MKTVYLPQDIAEMDAAAVAGGTDEYDLIAQAAEHIARTVRGVEHARTVVFFCGQGNNGADGFAAAHMLGATHACHIVVLAGGQAIRGAARRHLDDAQASGAHITYITNEAQLEPLRALEADVAVDAILGTGATHFPKGLFAAAVRMINGLQAHVIAVDIPTGVLPATGQVGQQAVRADETVTMQGFKPGLLLYPGAAYAGKVQLAHAFDTDYTSGVNRYVFDETMVGSLARDRHTHKGNYGRLAVIAGSAGMTGAGELCALAALRSGCGMLTLASPGGCIGTYRHKLTEAMTVELPGSGTYGPCYNEVRAFLAGKDACVVGPGMGWSKGVADTVRAAVDSGLPLVIDADALNAIARQGADMLDKASEAVVTPHPIELARLMGCDPDDVLADPLAAAEFFANEHRCICVLKMATTVIARPGETVFVTAGSAGMAKGGSGDVLAGSIGGLLAMTKNPFYAACLAAFACGKAGELAAGELGCTYMLPSDTLRKLSCVYQRFE